MILVWHRADLRVHDHPALVAATARGAGVVPCFILDPPLLRLPYSGAVRIAWLHANLQALHRAYAALGSSLVLRAGQPEEELLKLARDCGATAVYAVRSYEPIGRARDERVRRALEASGVGFHLLNGDCILEPGLVRTQTGGAYRVFTPFWRAWSALPLPAPLPAPPQLEPHGILSLELPAVQPSLPLPAAGEAAALQRLEAFMRRVGLHYQQQRDQPAVDGTSRLSTDLHLGVLSARVAADVARRFGMTAWLRELCWRDFYRHILWQEPRLVVEAFKPDWNDFPWRDDAAQLEAWRQGMTGYPIVDAGMRQLQTTGWMHNRVRMIVASFLTKHLLISWQAGEAIFNEWLLDGDQASNNGGWQWAAGCGVDAAPYFRVFNPVTQGQKFDPEAAYIKHYLPELEGLPTAEAHQPWTSLHSPSGYPAPLLPLKLGRERFLETAKQHLKRYS